MWQYVKLQPKHWLIFCYKIGKIFTPRNGLISLLYKYGQTASMSKETFPRLIAKIPIFEGMRDFCFKFAAFFGFEKIKSKNLQTKKRTKMSATLFLSVLNNQVFC